MIYTISKGKHYPEGHNLAGYALGGPHLGLLTMTKTVVFTPSCLSLPNRPDCDNDWNKLFGWSYGWHHSNSIRVAWKPPLDKAGVIRIGFYIYERGKVRYAGMGNIKVDLEYDISITHDDLTNTLSYRIRNSTYDRQLSTPWRGIKKCAGYRLGLYYGGNCPAPNDMEIYIK